MKQTLVKFYVIVALLCMPLYYENGYFNTLDAKTHIFWVASGITLSVALIIWLVKVLMDQKVDFDVAQFKAQFSLMDGAIAAFGITAVLSCIFSEYKIYAFSGSQGWNIGAWTIICLVLLYFYISRNYYYQTDLWVYIVIACTCLYVLGLLNGIGIDPLGLHQKLAESEMFEYIATIGNINSYSGYLSMSIPLLSMVFIIEERKWLRNWIAVLIFLGATNLVVNNSDGAFLGCGIGFMFLIYYCLKNPEKYRGLVTVGLLFAAGLAMMKLIVDFWPIEMVELSGMSDTFVNKYLFVPVAVVCALVMLVDIKKHEIFTETFAKWASRIFAVLAVVGVAAIVIYTAMHFSGQWGTKRGWIWGFAVQVFAGGSIREKLIGVGPDCFGIPVMDQFSDFISEHWGKRIANAHNEFMQYLVTMGLVGLVSYCMMWFSAFREYVKRVSWQEEKAPFFFAIMGYMGQAVVNNPQALNMATLFLFFAIYRSFDLPHETTESILSYESGSKGKRSPNRAATKRKRR